MADEKILNKIMNEYDELRTRAANERRMSIERVNKKVPKIAEIDNEIFRRGLENTNNILKNPQKKDEYNNDFSKNLRRLEAEKRELLKKYNIPEDYDKYRYSCKNCNDTGYDSNGKKCTCFKQKLINEAYSMSNLANLVKKQNFETFSFDYYSKKPFENEKSPYENMVMIYNKCKTFCENFDNETKGIVFYGSTGLGKTFLSSAIAKELMDNGKIVVYVRATKMFALYEDYRYGRNADKSVIDNIYNADLLIIDDLGTESSNKNNTAFLFDVVNERIAENKKIIINTNLPFNEITNIYSFRFTSRLYENFNMYKFYGDDIRIQKMKNNVK